MTLLLSNEDVEKVITMSETIEALEAAYLEMADQKALSRPRSDILMAGGQQGQDVYGFKSMEGALLKEGVVALRFNSDIIRWPERAGVVIREKVPSLPGGRWLGLIQLFSAVTGELLAMISDGVIQRFRVGGTSALGARYLAREEAATVGLVGSGWQAGAQAMGLCAVRPVRKIRVYSPNSEHRQSFAAEWSKRLGIGVQAVPTVEEAVKDSDIVCLTTNAVEPVLNAGLVKPGQHVSAIKRGEIGDDILMRSDVLVLHTQEGKPKHYFVGGLEVSGLNKAYRPMPREADGDITALVQGRVKRKDQAQITCFLNNMGLGLQFAAVAHLVYQKAQAAGLGRILPTEWFTEDVHP
ncbi:ornithine cyclodeaminase family protein [Candidatus Formimonas warabiya]|uniref:Ornithine cyclodeaminase family protein n=1 Tax=Formimonas warabiya TaxID=1761012 RepID=A0A3G1KXS1_FORW1|nr:ornithine cyclodeaminase family protein [Candidatus Formimonas warabiya]ATW27197.1 hypothetical protein DCMF_22770 [Candidatus Formimonas warabiya]